MIYIFLYFLLGYIISVIAAYFDPEKDDTLVIGYSTSLICFWPICLLTLILLKVNDFGLKRGNK